MIKRFLAMVSEKETRPVYYNSNTERFFGEMKNRYDWTNPLEAVAGMTNAVTQVGGLDAVAKDVLQGADSKEKMYQPYSGLIPRTRENVAGAIDDLFHLRPFSLVSRGINVVGDGIADSADLLAGVSQRNSSANYDLAA